MNRFDYRAPMPGERLEELPAWQRAHWEDAWTAEDSADEGLWGVMDELRQSGCLHCGGLAGADAPASRDSAGRGRR